MTGGNAGIGRAIVLLFLEHGAKVAAFDIRASEHSTSVDEPLLHIECDVSSEKSVDTAITQVTAEWGQIDILVNCAGVMDNFGTFIRAPLQQFLDFY